MELKQIDAVINSSARALNQSFKVEKIVGRRLVDGKLNYKVKWVNFDSDDDTWDTFVGIFFSFFVPILFVVAPGPDLPMYIYWYYN